MVDVGGRRAWVSLDPVLVCEVTYERVQSGRFRHSATFVRWRDDRDPHSCTFEQVGAEPPSWWGQDGSSMTLHNGEIAELLLQAAAEQEGHRKLALERASKEAWRWPEEAAEVAASGRPLTGLRSVGPWVAEQIERWLEDPPAVPEPDPVHRNYLDVRSAHVGDRDRPDVARRAARGPPGAHAPTATATCTLPDMVDAARATGLAYMSITDHSRA